MSDTALSFEEHGEILAHWHELGWSRETVVCLDRHLDLKRIASDDLTRLQSASQCATRSGPSTAMFRSATTTSTRTAWTTSSTPRQRWAS